LTVFSPGNFISTKTPCPLFDPTIILTDKSNGRKMSIEPDKRVDDSIPEDTEVSFEMISKQNVDDEGSAVPGHKPKSKAKKIKKNLKKIIKIAKHPISSTRSLSSIDSDQKKEKKPKRKKKKHKAEAQNDDEIDSDLFSLVKYEKAKYELADKSDLIDTLLSKIQLLEETIREKDEVILRLQNIDILQQTIQEKNEIIHKLQMNDKVPSDTFTNEFKNNARLLNEIRKKKKELENFRTDYRNISSESDTSTEEDDAGKANNENLFFYWKRQDNKINDTSSHSRELQPPAMSKSASAEVAKTKRLESSDVLHRLRKANTTATAPQKKTAEPWKTVHTFLVPVFKKSVAERTLIRKALENNYVFENLNAAAIESFIQAFENVQVRKGHEIIKQGDSVDYFYIVADGQVSIDANGKESKHNGPGTGFGELALLDASARNVSVVAESEPTQLFRVDQKTFRYTMRRTVKEATRQKMDLLKGVKILQDFDPYDLQRLCDNMLGAFCLWTFTLPSSYCTFSISCFFLRSFI
jgi:hypothetical protein